LHLRNHIHGVEHSQKYQRISGATGETVPRRNRTIGSEDQKMYECLHHKMNMFRLIDVQSLKVVESSFNTLERAGSRRALQALHGFDVLFFLPFAQCPPMA
jgi:hypothetical protein